MQIDWKSSLPLIAAAITAAATLLASVIAVMFGWLKERNESAKRSQYLKEAIDQTMFWKEWYLLRVLIGSPEEVETLQEKARTAIARVEKELQHGITRPIRPHSVLRRMFLLYSPLNYLMWLPRAFFYLLLICTFPYAIEIMSLSAEIFQKSANSQLASILITKLSVSPSNAPIDSWSSLFNSPDARYMLVVIVLSIVSIFVWVAGMLVYATVIIVVRSIALDLDKDRGWEIAPHRLEAFKKWVNYEKTLRK